MAKEFDLVVRGGTIADGSGATLHEADVAVKDGKIVGVGKYNEAATRTINADGRVVAPGFIDHHTHFDSQAMWDPIVNSTSLNGNTSIIVGQCGAVIAPVRPGDGEWYLKMFNYMEGVPLDSQRAGVDFAWETIPEYLDAIERRRGINVGALVGHSGLRRYVMGEAAQEREATPGQAARDLRAEVAGTRSQLQQAGVGLESQTIRQRGGPPALRQQIPVHEPAAPPAGGTQSLQQPGVRLGRRQRGQGEGKTEGGDRECSGFHRSWPAVETAASVGGAALQQLIGINE